MERSFTKTQTENEEKLKEKINFCQGKQFKKLQQKNKSITLKDEIAKNDEGNNLNETPNTPSLLKANSLKEIMCMIFSCVGLGEVGVDPAGQVHGVYDQLSMLT